MKYLLYLPLILFSFLELSCQNESDKGNINKTISAEEFKKIIETKAEAQLVDVRTQGEFNERHIPNATLMNINEPGFQEVINTLDKSKPVLVYCLSGGRSSNAAGIMKDAGFKEVYNLKGGIMEWSANNFPIEAGHGSQAKKGMGMNEFEKQVGQSAYVLVDFHAKWCGPCKKIAPILEKISAERKDKLTLLKIDADEHPQLLKDKGIVSIPYLELYKDGKLIWKHTGLIDESAILKETGL